MLTLETAEIPCSTLNADTFMVLTSVTAARICRPPAFAIALTGVMIVATSWHGHRHTHNAIEHTHRIDPNDPHHQLGAIEPIDADLHRHLVLAHEHPHVPDIHHRHEH